MNIYLRCTPLFPARTRYVCPVNVRFRGVRGFHVSLQIFRRGPERITRGTIGAAWKQRASNQRTVISDAECRGLALVVNATSMSWRFDYKPRGLNPLTGKRWPSRSITIGNPETHSPDQARSEAGRLKGQAKAGKDPALRKKAELELEAQKRSQTMARLVEEYAIALPQRQKFRGGRGKLSPRAVAEELAHVHAVIRELDAGDKPVTAILPKEITRMIASLSDKPATAKHRYGALSRFFDWAMGEELIASNPCEGVPKAKRPRPPNPRRNFHTPQQLAQLWSAIEHTEGLQQVHRDLLQFLIVVPCRRSEATGMDWRDVDLESAVWSQPGTQTKNGDPHRFHIPPLALEILHRRHQNAGRPDDGLVFPAPRSQRPIDTFGKLKAAVGSNLPSHFDWRVHDHRRSFVTALGELGVDEALLDSILNHRQAATRGGVLGVYQYAQRWPEQRAAMKDWDQLISNAIRGHVNK